MEKIGSVSELKEAILQLENRCTVEEELLREHFRIIRKKLSPSYVARTTFSELLAPTNLVRTILGATIGISAGYFSKKYFSGTGGRIIKKLLGRFF